MKPHWFTSSAFSLPCQLLAQTKINSRQLQLGRCFLEILFPSMVDSRFVAALQARDQKGCRWNQTQPEVSFRLKNVFVGCIHAQTVVDMNSRVRVLLPFFVDSKCLNSKMMCRFSILLSTFQRTNTVSERSDLIDTDGFLGGVAFAPLAPGAGETWMSRCPFWRKFRGSTVQPFNFHPEMIQFAYCCVCFFLITRVAFTQGVLLYECCYGTSEVSSLVLRCV